MLAVLLLTPVVQAQTSYPMITHTYPVAVQRGKTTELVVEGQMNFAGAYKVLVEGSGVQAEVIAESPPKSDAPKPPPVRTVKLKLTPSADAPLGVREFRIATALGLSSVGQLVVVDGPVVVETANNNTADKATELKLPSVACGKIEAAEDVDWFKFHAEAGQVVTFEVWCARLQDKIHDLQKHADPMLTLLDASGKELASSDDGRFADPLCAYRFEKAGDYLLQIRDSTYDGDPRWVYAIHMTSKPYVSQVYPLAIAPGQTAEVEPIGSARLIQPKVKVAVPADAPPGPRLVVPELSGAPANPVTMLVTSLPIVLEQEPNDQATEPTKIPIPSCINGRIGVKRDLDHFAFTAKKGQAIRFEVKARRFGTGLVSGLDASLDILDAKGVVLMTGDDISPAIKDASVTFNPPADGDYLLRVRDLLSKGGEQFVYAVEAEPVAPDFTIRCDGDKAMIGPGTSAAWYVHVVRLNGFTGPVKVEVKGLPAGVTASPLTIHPTMTQGLIVVTATADAKQDATNVELVGTASVKDAGGKELTLTRVVTPNQEIYSPGGGRARFDVNMQTVAVTGPSDIELVEVTPKTITLKPGEEIKLAVKVKRRADYDGPVTLDVKLRHLGTVFGDPLPPGVTMDDGKSKTLLGKASEGHIVLKAAPNATPIDNVPISVVANVSINFVVKVAYSSEAIPVSVGGAK
jgi:hypothetical protein